MKQMEDAKIRVELVSQGLPAYQKDFADSALAEAAVRQLAGGAAARQVENREGDILRFEARGCVIRAFELSQHEMVVPGREYLFHIEGLGREVWQAAISEKAAHALVWSGLDHEERDRVVQMECIDERALSTVTQAERPHIAWEDVDGDLHHAKVEGVSIGAIDRSWSETYSVTLYRSAASMGSEVADTAQAPTQEAAKARFNQMVEAALAKRTPSAVLEVIERTPAGTEAPDNLGWLYGEAFELRKVKMAAGGSYSPDDLESWETRLAVSAMIVTILKGRHPAFYQQLQQQAQNLVDLNDESLSEKESARDALEADLGL